MRIMFMTNEFPPHIYGGAGVHVEYLSKELAKLEPVEVRSFQDQSFVDGQLTVRGTKVDGSQFAGCPGAADLAAARARHLPRLQRPGHRRRHRPLPHLVRALRRHPRQAAVRHAAGDHRPFAGAAAAVEARTDRPRLRAVELDREDRAGDGRRGDRRLPKHARRHPSPVRRRRGEDARHPQRHRHRRVQAGRPAGGPGPLRHRLRRPVCAVRRPDDPAEGPALSVAGDRPHRSAGAGRAVRRRVRHAGAAGGTRGDGAAS